MFRKKVDSRRLLGLTLLAVALCAVGLIVGGTGTTRAQFAGGAGLGGEPKAVESRLFPNGLPKIELMLKSALDHHPDVLAARSKVRTAEAEQRQAELKAFKDLMDVRDRWEKVNRSLTELGPNHPSTRESLSSLAAIEWELSFLLGSRTETRPVGGSGVGSSMPVATTPAPSAPGAAVAAGTSSPVSSAIIDVPVPRGEQGKIMKAKLSEPIHVLLDETPLKEVAEYLSERSELRFILDHRALEDAGTPADSPITLKLGELELGAVLQALEDLENPICFVVRDYGILVTTQDAQPINSVTARDFWKLSEDELREKLRRRSLMNMGGGMGGMEGGTGGGGMGGMGGGMGGGGLGGGGLF